MFIAPFEIKLPDKLLSILNVVLSRLNSPVSTVKISRLKSVKRELIKPTFILIFSMLIEGKFVFFIIISLRYMSFNKWPSIFILSTSYPLLNNTLLVLSTIRPCQKLALKQYAIIIKKHVKTELTNNIFERFTIPTLQSEY